MKTKFEIIERRNTLRDSKKLEMMVILIRNRDAFEAVKDILRIEHVRHISDNIALVWKAVRKLFNRIEEMPTQSMILSEIHDMCEGTNQFSPEEIEEAEAFLIDAFENKQHGKKIATSASHAKIAIDTCKNFLEELVVDDARDQMLKDNTVPADLPRILQSVGVKLESVQSLSEPPIGVVCPPGWDDEPKQILTPTSFSAFDTFLGGGQTGGEVYGVMGPFGSCKTTLAVQLTGDGARTASSLYHASGDAKAKRPVVIFASTEMGLKEFRQRLLSFKAMIPRDRIAQCKLSELSDSKQPGAAKATVYEKKLFRAGKTRATKMFGGAFVNEQDRVRMAVDLVNHHVLFIDCTDTNPNRRSVGAGGVREIANIIAAQLRHYPDVVPYMFVLDHASALASKVIQLSDKYTYNDLRHIIKDIPQQVSEIIAKRYDIPCWIMHQLSGEANAKSSSAEMHHTEASESKSFAEYLDFAIVISRPDPRQFTRLRCTKHRRQPPKSLRIVKIDGRFCRVVDVSREFTVDDVTRKIVSIKDKQEVGDYNPNNSVMTPGKKKTSQF